MVTPKNIVRFLKPALTTLAARLNVSYRGGWPPVALNPHFLHWNGERKTWAARLEKTCNAALLNADQ